MVTFTPSGAWTEAGVKVGDYTFRSFPLPDHPGQYFSLFAFSWQLPVRHADVGLCEQSLRRAGEDYDFWYKVFPKKFRASTIALESMNIDRIVNQIDPEHKIPGDLVQRFVYINSEMRKVNNKTLADLRFQTEPKFLWTGAFLPMVDSTVESRFADDRTYTWQGKKVDEQTHLGFDLAKVAHSPIPASNDGRVIWAQDLGIYGNCIVIDHGFGLQTHLRPSERVSGEEGRHGQEGPDHRQDRIDRPRRRRPSALHDAGGWRPGERGRMVGSALGQGPDPEQDGHGSGRGGRSRTNPPAHRAKRHRK